MSTYNLRRFAQPDVLKNIQQDNLIQFLKTYEDYLVDRGFSFDLDEDNELDFEKLCEVLMNPTESMNIEFVEALFFIQEMSGDEHYEELHSQAETNNIEVGEEPSTADLRARVLSGQPLRSVPSGGGDLGGAGLGRLCCWGKMPLE